MFSGQGPEQYIVGERAAVLELARQARELRGDACLLEQEMATEYIYIYIYTYIYIMARLAVASALANGNDYENCDGGDDEEGDGITKVVVNRTCTNACRVCKYILVAKWSATERR